MPSNGVLDDLEHRLAAVRIERHSALRNNVGIAGSGHRGREEFVGVTLREGDEIRDLLSLQRLDLQQLTGLHLDRLPLPRANVTRPDRRFLTQQVAHSWMLLLAGCLEPMPDSL